MSQAKPNVVRRTPPPESVTTSPVPPIWPGVVYRARDADELDRVYEGSDTGFTYAREGHPNAAMLASKIARLEGAEAGLIACSGMAAASAILLTFLKSDDHVVAGNQLYGRTSRILQSEIARFGVRVDLVDVSDAAAIAAAVRPETRLIFVEVVSNPLLRVADLETLGRLARQNNILLVVDNTFPTPLSFQPLGWSASLVVHSVTKMLAGHSDVTLGAVCGPRHLVESVRETVVTWGFNPSPFDCWLADRGLHTLELRFQRAQRNAAALAELLAGDPAVNRVFYPGRPDHPDAALAQRLLAGECGTMVSFELKGGRDTVNRFLRALREIPFAPTLGDVATMVSHPASSSHRGLTAEQRATLGIREGTIRVSLGIEDPEILLAEFAAALRAAI